MDSIQNSMKMPMDALKSQSLFMSCAKAVLGNEKLVSSGMLRSRFVEQTSFDAVLWILLGHTDDQKKFCPLFKVVILVKHGEVLLFQFYASFETLKYNEFGELNPLEASCYEVFRRFSDSANMQLRSGRGLFDTQVMHSPRKLYSWICWLQRYSLCFSMKCSGCGNLLKDFLPPTLFTDDAVTGSKYFHEMCRKSDQLP